MATNLEIDRIIQTTTEELAPVILFKVLSQFPEFRAVRQRLRDAHLPLWRGLDLLHRRGRSLVSKYGLERIEWAILRVLAEDADSVALLQSYETGLQQICDALGSPRHLFEQVLLEDFTLNSAYGDLIHDASKLVLEAGLEDIGKWNWEMRHAIEEAAASGIGADATRDFADPTAATRNEKEIERIWRKFERDCAKLGPKSPLHIFLAKRMRGDSVSKIAKEAGFSEAWTQKLLGRAHRLLGIKTRRGRPEVRPPAFEVWPSLRFGVDTA